MLLLKAIPEKSSKNAMDDAGHVTGKGWGFLR